MMTLFSEYGVSPAMSRKFRWNQFDELVQRIGKTDLLLAQERCTHNPIISTHITLTLAVEKVKAGQAEIPLVPDYTLTNPINNTFLHLEPLSNNTNVCLRPTAVPYCSLLTFV